MTHTEAEAKISPAVELIKQAREVEENKKKMIDHLSKEIEDLIINTDLKLAELKEQRKSLGYTAPRKPRTAKNQ